MAAASLSFRSVCEKSLAPVVSLASGLTLAGGQKTARVYKKNFTGRVALQLATT